MLGQGDIELTALQTDVNGNVSAVSTLTLTIDTIAENLAPRLARDTGNSNGDGITNVSVLNVSGIEDGATWEYQVDGGAWNLGSAESFNLTAGTHVYSVRQTDIAGNVSAVSTHTLTLDTAAATLELNLDSDTGISNGDDITNIAVVNVVGIEDGATWEYQVDGGDWYAGSARSFNLTEGTYPYSVRQTDLAGNVGNAGGYAVTWSGIDASGDRSVFVQQFNSDGTTTKSSVDVQTASGQDSSLGRYETSVTLQVSYTGLSEGQVIEFFESGASLGVSHTVSATDVSAGRANVVVQKDDLGGIGDHWLKVKVTDLAGNVSAESPVAIVLTVDDRPASVISLGAGNGQLINGVQVEGKWYFVWDRDASGDVSLGLTPGSAPDDRTDVGTLARTFLGANAVATDITENNALFTVNGVQLKLPVAGVALPATSLDFMPGTTWSNGTLGWDTDQNSNVTYDGLLAVWDAYNGTGTGAGDLGQPPNWTEAYYWTANSYADRHGYVGAYGEVGYDANVNFNFVVFQVL